MQLEILKRTFGSYAASQKQHERIRVHITRNSMQLATGSDLTTSRLGQPHYVRGCDRRKSLKTGCVLLRRPGSP